MTENRAVYLASVNGGILGDVPLDPKFETPELGLGQEKLLNTVCSLNVRRGGTPHTEGNGEGTDETSTVGSGFVVSAAGMVLTNAHVVSGCEAIRVTTARGERRTASLAAADPQSDLALLSSSGGFSSVAAFRAGRPLRLAEEIVALGYPLHGLLASGVNVSTGTVSALAGIANDSAKVQISAPVQPGNSGGPVLDLSGALVGIVVAKLDAIKMAKAIGDIPQNVNFAIKADVARLFLEAQGVSLQSAPAGPPRKKEDVAAMGREFTVLVECLKGEDAK
jgi:S1-C subfamily serine protease